jgi:uncharacterized protein (DUF1697 family)
MPIYIALLRAINVGGRNKVAMADLRELLGKLGYTDARSLLQSGNLVFEGDRRSGALLEHLLETETEKHLGVTVQYMVRTASEWATLVEQNPFPAEAASDPGHLVVIALKKSPGAADVKSLQAASKGPEIIRAQGKQLYVYYPAGVGESRLTNALIEKMLDSRATGRNWNTVLKLQAMLDV